MKRSLAVGLYVAGLLFGTIGGALADDDDGSPGGGGEQAPGGRRFQGGFPGGGGPGGGGFRRQHGARPPKMEQVMSLQSLSKDQQTQIQAIYSSAKEEMKPLMQQMRDSRAKMKSGGGGGQSGPGGADGGPAAGGSDGGARRGFGEAMSEMRPLMQQLKAKREATWTKVKAVLTDAQIKELEQMRGGNQRPGGAGVPGGPGLRSQPQDDDQWTKDPPDNSDDR